MCSRMRIFIAEKLSANVILLCFFPAVKTFLHNPHPKLMFLNYSRYHTSMELVNETVCALLKLDTNGGLCIYSYCQSQTCLSTGTEIYKRHIPTLEKRILTIKELIIIES